MSERGNRELPGHEEPYVEDTGVYVTENSEYHLREGVCVAVRQRATGEWIEGHPALGKRLTGGLRVAPGGSVEPHPAAPEVGDRLCFGGGGERRGASVLTSSLVAVVPRGALGATLPPAAPRAARDVRDWRRERDRR